LRLTVPSGFERPIPLPPLSEQLVGETDPLIAAANLRIRVHYETSPFGAFCAERAFSKGKEGPIRIMEVDEVQHQNPRKADDEMHSIDLSLSYRNEVRYLAGDQPLLDALTFRVLDAHFASLSLARGLADSESRRAARARIPSGAWLATLALCDLFERVDFKQSRPHFTHLSRS
jgi:hypothetical protein